MNFLNENILWMTLKKTEEAFGTFFVAVNGASDLSHDRFSTTKRFNIKKKKPSHIYDSS